MTDAELQKAIDTCLTIIVEKGSNLKHYQSTFYDRLTSVTLKLLEAQAARAGMLHAPAVRPGAIQEVVK